MPEPQAPNMEELLRALDSAEADERVEAAEWLVSHALREKPEDREPLHAAFARLVNDSDPRARLLAGQGLGLSGDAAAATRVLTTVLNDGDAHLALFAARELAQLRDPAGADRLLAALEHGHLRFDALEALRVVGEPRALEPARRIFGSWFSDRWQRAQAAALLASLGEREGLDYLRRRSEKRRAGERGLVLELLGEVHAEGAYDLLAAVAQDAADRNRTAAVAGLGFLGDGRARELLQKLAESDPDEDVQDEAREALAVLDQPPERR
jgi:HEAT repeat protein